MLTTRVVNGNQPIDQGSVRKVGQKPASSAPSRAELGRRPTGQPSPEAGVLSGCRHAVHEKAGAVTGLGERPSPPRRVTEIGQDVG